ncbi:MAG: PAS-domain containing protein [Rhodospirillaceae bacterium]|nr:PAS-domain containing protein [Rhodospirillaceae bacterium]
MAALISVAVLAVTGVILARVYDTSRASLLQERRSDVRQTALTVVQQVDTILAPVRSVVAQAIDIAESDLANEERLHAIQAIAAGTVKSQKRISGVYVGFPDGSFEMSIAVPTEVLGAIGVTEITGPATIRRVIDRRSAEPSDSWFYQEPSTKQWHRSQAKPTPYDPRARPWYRQALETNDAIWTEPYPFATAGELGITYASPMRARAGELIGVVGVDFTLSDLSAVTQEQARSISGTTFIANRRGELIGHPEMAEYLKGLAGEAANAKVTIGRLAARLNLPDDLGLFHEFQDGGDKAGHPGARPLMAMQLPLSRESGLDYSVYVGIPEEVAIGKAADELKRNILILAGLLALLAIAVAYMAKLRTEILLRRRTEAAMMEVSGQLNAALDHMSGGIMMVDRDLRIQLFNRNFIEAYKVPEVVKGMSLQDALMLRAARGDYGPGDPSELVRSRIEMYRQPSSSPAEDVGPEGKIIEILRSPTPDGGVVSVFNDVTERKAAESELRRVHYALEHAADGVLWFGRKGKVVEANLMAGALLDRPRDSLIGAHISTVMQGIDDRIFGLIWKAVSTRTVDVPGEQTLLRADGTALPVETLSKFIAFGGNEYICTFMRDITQRKKAQADLERAKEAAEEATKAKSSFLAMMSHEIRTPMNGVMSMAEMLDQTELTEDQKSMTSVVRGSAQALLTIINDILDFSKIEAGKLDIEKVPFSLTESVEGVGELIGARADDKGLGLLVDIDPAIPDLLIGDPTRLRQILLNLAGNAIKFTETGGISITVSPLADETEQVVRVRFEVTDTGIGLTEEQQARLFKPFVQADASTARKYGGTGLGLSICQRLSEMMGGAIGVRSESGKGSTFWFELPFQASDGERDHPDFDISDARVVAAGFEPALRRAAERLLAAGGVRDVVWMETSDDIVSELRRRHEAGGAGDILLVRATPSDQSGLEVARGVLMVADSWETKVVLVASRAMASTLAAADRAGLFASLALPLRRRRLWHVLAAACGLTSLEARQAAFEDDAIGWVPPETEDARAAGALILVAEDNTTNQIVIRRLLGQRGYACEVFDNGALALAAYRQGEHGLVLTDFHMPEMDGFELTRKLRVGEAPGQRVPIVALTADALPGTEQQCLDAGMDTYLTKPIDSKALLAALEKWLPQARALRRRPSARKAEAADSSKALPDIDPQVLDLQRLSETFGGFGEEARTFLAGFIADVPRMIEAVASALSAQEKKAARDAAHALKGAARSVGAQRLGQIASDVQDCLDGDDVETAAIFAGLLHQTFEEMHRDTARLTNSGT